MTKKDFFNETFGFKTEGEVGFRSGGIYGKKFKNIDIGLVHLRLCFDYKIYDKENKRIPLSFRNSKNVLVKLWKKAKTVEEFKLLIKKDKEASLTQFAGELFKNDRDFLKQFINKEQCFETSSNMGGVKIGTNGFSVIAPNGYGDTIRNIVSINEQGTFNWTAFTFWTSIEGEEINIYYSDCGNDIAVTLRGRYGVYYNNRVIIFERWNA